MQTTATLRFNHLIELYYPALFRSAALLCGTPEGALALTQQTFRRALGRRAESSPAPANVQGWLFALLFLEFLERRRGCGADDSAGAHS